MGLEKSRDNREIRIIEVRIIEVGLYCMYRKHRRISRTFLLKIFVSNWRCGLSARTSVHHAVNLHKLTLLKELLTGLTLPFLSRQMSLNRESPFRHKVVYSVNDGCSLRSFKNFPSLSRNLHLHSLSVRCLSYGGVCLIKSLVIVK